MFLNVEISIGKLKCWLLWVIKYIFLNFVKYLINLFVVEWILSDFIDLFVIDMLLEFVIILVISRAFLVWGILGRI